MYHVNRTIMDGAYLGGHEILRTKDFAELTFPNSRNLAPKFLFFGIIFTFAKCFLLYIQFALVPLAKYDIKFHEKFLLTTL
jgi:hypothetical protein